MLNNRSESLPYVIWSLGWVESRSVAVNIGLPEWDDRLNRWRVPLVSERNVSEPIGEVQVSSSGDIEGSTDLDLCLERARLSTSTKPGTHTGFKGISITPVPSKIILGDARTVLNDFPPNTAQLVFTSPPYFNAKPESHESLNYEHYLDFLRDVFQKCHAILSEGRFLVVNTSPCYEKNLSGLCPLMRRTSRASSSKRLPIPYDLHPILRNTGFDFIDDIIWEKPEGAGWNLVLCPRNRLT